MGVIDLTTQSEVKHNWSLEAGILTVTFTDPTGVTIYGSLKIEGVKARSLMEAMSEVSNFFFPVTEDQTTREFHITHFAAQTGTADTEFV